MVITNKNFGDISPAFSFFRAFYCEGEFCFSEFESTTIYLIDHNNPYNLRKIKIESGSFFFQDMVALGGTPVGTDLGKIVEIDNPTWDLNLSSQDLIAFTPDLTLVKLLSEIIEFILTRKRENFYEVKICSPFVLENFRDIS